MKKQKFQEKGQALIVIALAIVVLFGFASIAIDGTRVLSDKRHAQNAADTSVLAAALAKIREKTNYKDIGLQRAASNGYTNDTDSTVIVQMCNETGVTCVGLPAGADPSEYIKVTVTSTVPMTFANVIGWHQITNVAEAIAHVVGTNSSTVFGGDAIVSLSKTGHAFSSNGNFTVDVNGSGIFSNSSDNCSTDMVGNGSIQVDTSITIASGGTQCRGTQVTAPNPVAGTQVSDHPASLDIPAPTITCSGNGSLVGNTYQPGNYSSINPSGNVSFAPGNYCFNSAISISGNTNITANDVNFRIDGGITINGNSTFTCSNAMFYSVNGGIKFNGNGSNSCTGVTFYMASGNVSWNGNAANTFTAPTSGTYKGLLIYLPYGNTSGLTINGNSGSQLTGSIIAVSSNVGLSGNSGTSGMDTAIIAYTVSAAGNSQTTINYNAANQYLPPANPTIQFTK